MTSSIGPESIQNPSIFSFPESILSSTTQWTFEESIKLHREDCIVEGDDRREADDRSGQQKHITHIGRPPIKWTRSRLRKLIRLYLLTDLELDGNSGIIYHLRTEDFRPCKRHVQEKLNQLLQPQPNKIRPKGDTKVLRKLFLECRHQQKTRRLQKKKHSCRHERRSLHLNNEAEIRPAGYDKGFASSITHDSSCTNVPEQPDASLSSFNWYDPNCITSTSTSWETQPTPSVLPEEQSKSYVVSTPHVDFELPTSASAPSLPPPFLGWHLADFGMSQSVDYAPIDECPSYSANSISVSQAAYDLVEDDLLPDCGFGSEFGYVEPRSSHPIRGSETFLEAIESCSDSATASRVDDNFTSLQMPRTSGSLTPSFYYNSTRDKLPVVNSTHELDNFVITSDILSDNNSCYDFDTQDILCLGIEPLNSNMPHKPTQEESPLSSQRLISSAQSSITSVDHQSISNISSSSSRISVLLSKMSISRPSSSLDVEKGQLLTHEDEDIFTKAESLIKLPGSFPEYCWQHINQNILRRCNQWHDSQKCRSSDSLMCFTVLETHQSFRTDVLWRVAHHTVRASDIHEMDAFGNSTIHISATLLAPPRYLNTLIRMGASVNKVNNAGQTFLHLIRPEAFNHCDDLCELLELLSVRDFNFCQHDHLGQSPLHVLTRPWVNPDVLRQIIKTLDSLPIHRHFSTARDCLGYTVVGQLNLQGSQSSEVDLDLDHAILSLACETDKPIADCIHLQMLKGKAKDRNAVADDVQLARNYENHPSITSLDDLLQYEQHVDYWRTILTAKDSPWFEDSNGRNGLHCLAEATLVSPDMPLPGLLLSQLESFGNTILLNGNINRESLTMSLLNAGVDPNNYDNNGLTPLMAFILHQCQAESEDSTTKILNSLLEAGSNICRRNRRGETALHLAVKLGRRTATKILLTSGANVHARTNSGLGVLELAQKHTMESQQDENLYAQIMLCMSLATSFGALSKPTILDEWASCQWRLATHVPKERKGLEIVRRYIEKKSERKRGGAGWKKPEQVITKVVRMICSSVDN